jgi:O-antigen/teichoic acid export membrane protein
VPTDLARDFTWLLIGQSLLLGFSFAARILSHMLTAHQWYDLNNYAQALLFAGNYGVMWLCFVRGHGVFSNLLGALFGAVVATEINAWGCSHLKLLPRRGEWGHFDGRKFRELFAFGRDFFLYAAGMQRVNASQTLLLTRFFGLEVPAVWNGCTRTYLLLSQLIGRIFDYSSATLAEMMVRGERDRLLQRFREIAVFSTGMSLLVGAMLALCNSPFIQVWTSGRIAWHPINDLLLALWLVANTVANLHIGLVGQTKDFRFLRYLTFLEGVIFVGAGILFLRSGGMTSLLVASLICTCAFRLPYGLYRNCRYFKLPVIQVVRWHNAIWWMGMLLLPAGLLIWWALRHWGALAQLFAGGSVLGALAIWALLRYGLPEALRREILQRAPGWAKPALGILRFV